MYRSMFDQIATVGGVAKFDNSSGVFHRKAVSAEVVRQVDARTVKIVATDGRVDRAGDIVEPSGAMLDAYMQNPIVCFNHDTSRPVARCIEIGQRNGRIEATVRFPPAGVSATSDEVCGLIKAGVLSGWSIGFQPIESKPMDPGNPKNGPRRYTKWELMEISAVSVPCNPGAVVVERSATSPMRRAAGADLRAQQNADRLKSLIRAAHNAPTSAHAAAAWRAVDVERTRQASAANGG